MAIWKFGRQSSKNCCWISRRSWSVAPTLGQDENFQKAMAEAMQQAAVGHWVAWVSLLLTVNHLVNRTGATWKLFNQLVIYLAARNQAVAFEQSCDWKVPTKFQPFGAPCTLSFPARPRPRSPSLPSRSPGVPGLVICNSVIVILHMGMDQKWGMTGTRSSDELLCGDGSN